MHTIFGDYQSGTKVNIEVDVIARYLERLLLGGNVSGDEDGADGDASLTELARSLLDTKS